MKQLSEMKVGTLVKLLRRYLKNHDILTLDKKCKCYLCLETKDALGLLSASEPKVKEKENGS